MAEEFAASVRLPDVRRALLRDVSTLGVHANEVDEVAFGDAVEEVWHLLDPSHGREPGDVLLNDAEVEMATRLWSALDRATWPLDPTRRSMDSDWAQVTQLATALLDVAAR
jgi:hypothetical protein